MSKKYKIPHRMCYLVTFFLKVLLPLNDDVFNEAALIMWMCVHQREHSALQCHHRAAGFLCNAEKREDRAAKLLPLDNPPRIVFGSKQLITAALLYLFSFCVGFLLA